MSEDLGIIDRMVAAGGVYALMVLCHGRVLYGLALSLRLRARRHSVGAHEQDATAGSVAAPKGLGIVPGPIAASSIYTLDNCAPFALIGLTLLIVALRRERSCDDAGCECG